MIQLRVSDLKQYFYCPRILYYTYCVPLPRPVTHPMQVGAVEHEVLSVFERRRGLRKYGLTEGQRVFHVSVESETLGLAGVLDLLITTEQAAFPVEFKHTEQRLNQNAKYQLVAYAMMVEESLGRPVEYGFIYRMLKQQIAPVAISGPLRQGVLNALEQVRQLIRREELAEPPRQRGKCVECEFRRYCRDVL